MCNFTKYTLNISAISGIQVSWLEKCCIIMVNLKLYEIPRTLMKWMEMYRNNDETYCALGGFLMGFNIAGDDGTIFCIYSN